MKDTKLREDVARLEERVRHLEKTIEQVPIINFSVSDFNRRFNELVRELGFSFDEDGVFNREAKADSSLGKLQTQISALVDAGGFEETYSEGKLVFKKIR